MSYRQAVALIIQNPEGRLFFAERADAEGAWQFPQGGIDADETAEQAAWRELKEETGLSEDQVILLKESTDWTTYDLPKEFVRSWKGQKQKWFLFLLKEGVEVDLSTAADQEFSQYKWILPEDCIHQVAGFRKDSYRLAMHNLGLIEA